MAKPLGRVQASNAGLKECTGDWIATIDDDDVWRPNLVSSLLNFAQEQGFEFVSALAETPKGHYDLPRKNLRERTHP